MNMEFPEDLPGMGADCTANRDDNSRGENLKNRCNAGIARLPDMVSACSAYRSVQQLEEPCRE